MKRVYTGAVIIGAMVGQLAAQGGITSDTVAGVHSYNVGTVGVLPLGDAAAALAISNPPRWGLPVQRPSGGPADNGHPDWQYRPPCVDKPEVCHHGSSGFPDWGYASDPAFYPENYSDNPNPVLPSAIVVVAAPQEPQSPPPTPPAQSQVREYNWPPSATDSNATTFSIVSKYGRVQSAIAVWVQANALCYYAPDSSTGRIPIDSIDREATRQRNADKQLSLSLPPEHQADLSMISGGQ